MRKLRKARYSMVQHVSIPSFRIPTAGVTSLWVERNTVGMSLSQRPSAVMGSRPKTGPAHSPRWFQPCFQDRSMFQETPPKAASEPWIPKSSHSLQPSLLSETVLSNWHSQVLNADSRQGCDARHRCLRPTGLILGTRSSLRFPVFRTGRLLSAHSTRHPVRLQILGPSQPHHSTTGSPMRFGTR